MKSVKVSLLALNFPKSHNDSIIIMRTVNRHLLSSGESSGEQRRTIKGKLWWNNEASIGAAVVGKKARLGTK